MKRFLTALSFTTVMVLSACGGEEQNEHPQDNEGNPSDADENQINDNGEGDTAQDGDDENGDAADDLAADGAEADAGETIENEAGEFTVQQRQEDTDTIESGPVVLEIEQAVAASGDISGELADQLREDEIDYVQVDITVENTGDEEVNFYVSQPMLITDTGEELRSNRWLNDHLAGEPLEEGTQSGSLFFVLEETSAEEIESATLVWDAPFDEDWEDVGDDVEAEVVF
ncbi:hypothetical protein [Evansella clarkii]|uniref:hypothetical protein n=1 Tax=Evansella clarkii TaxID=79879 RepID=UPI0009980998|nr:hypothetical protein [Evansella clarkii]